VGGVERQGRVDLGGDVELELVRCDSHFEYARLMSQHDLGLAMMYTPHPGQVPIEMAAAGMLTVTNTFENKTPEALRAISSNLIATGPSIDAIASALIEAADGVDDVERRVRGSAVNWSRDWSNSFDDRLLNTVEAYLLGP
jgi:hypothetical protein